MVRSIKISMNSHVPKPMLWFVDHLLKEDIVVFLQLGRLGLHLPGIRTNLHLIINLTNYAINLINSFMFNGLLCYFHWEAMLISNLSKVVIPMPFSNMQELYESDYRFTTLGGSAFSDSFKNGNKLWQLIYREKLEVLDEYCASKQDCLDWLLLDTKNAIYYGYNGLV